MTTQKLTLYFTVTEKGNEIKYSVQKDIDRDKNNLKVSFNELVDLISGRYKEWKFQSLFSFTVDEKDGM